ncbi:hypothetical protein LCGC14_2987010, partial [marine sediment metagenome]
VVRLHEGVPSGRSVFRRHPCSKSEVRHADSSRQVELVAQRRAPAYAEVVELADTYVLGTYAFGLVGSIPTFSTLFLSDCLSGNLGETEYIQE